MRNIFYCVAGILAGMLLAVSMANATAYTTAFEAPAGSRGVMLVTMDAPAGQCLNSSDSGQIIGQAVIRAAAAETFTENVYCHTTGKAQFMNRLSLSPVRDAEGKPVQQYEYNFLWSTILGVGSPEYFFSVQHDSNMSQAAALAGVVSALLLWGAVLYNQ